MKPALLGIIIVLVLIVGGAFFYAQDLLTREPAVVPGATGTNLYANGTYGVVFEYPDTYVLTEKEIDRDHYSIVLVRKEDALPRENAEGPTALTIDFYKNDSDTYTLNTWRDADVSNFRLGSGMYASTTIAGTDAISYRWSGLYEGETTAFVHRDQLVAVSVTYLESSDPIRADYYVLLNSLTLAP